MHIRQQARRRSLREVTWAIVQPADESAHYLRMSAWFDVFILSLILLNVLAVIVGTVQAVQQRAGVFLYGFEVFSVLVFTVEYIARVWACVEDERYRHPVWGRLKFARTPMALVDFLAVLPFYLPFLGVDLRFARILRLLRIFRIIKVSRYKYFASLRLFARVVRRKKEELIVTFALLSLMLVITASLMYYAERQAQPEVFSSIPATMWWAVVTLTTVGYGDTYPITMLGRLFGAAVAILGVGLFALPTSILGSGFVEALEKRNAQKDRDRVVRCPHCAELVHKDEWLPASEK